MTVHFSVLEEEAADGTGGDLRGGLERAHFFSDFAATAGGCQTAGAVLFVALGGQLHLLHKRYAHEVSILKRVEGACNSCIHGIKPRE